MGIDISKEEIREFLKNKEFKKTVLDAMESSTEDDPEKEEILEDKELIKKVTGDVLKTFKSDEEIIREIVELISKKIHRSPELKAALMSEALKDPNFKKRIIDRIVRKMD